MPMHVPSAIVYAVSWHLTAVFCDVSPGTSQWTLFRTPLNGSIEDDVLVSALIWA